MAGRPDLRQRMQAFRSATAVGGSRCRCIPVPLTKRFRLAGFYCDQRADAGLELAAVLVGFAAAHNGGLLLPSRFGNGASEAGRRRGCHHHCRSAAQSHLCFLAFLQRPAIGIFLSLDAWLHARCSSRDGGKTRPSHRPSAAACQCRQTECRQRRLASP